MDRRKLEKLRGELAGMRRSPQPARRLKSLAKKLGRALTNRGKHPMWMNEHFDLPPLSIPDGGGKKDIPEGTKNCIVNQLEEDLLAWEDWLEEHSDD